MPSSIETLHTWDTEYSADSVEWCPLSPHQNVFVCGTYQLSKSEPSKENASAASADPDKPADRLGRLYLFTVTAADGLSLQQTIEMPAILDMKWCHVRLEGHVLLAIVNAIGEVLIYELDNCNLSLKMKCSVGEDGDTLALSLDWSTGRSVGDPSIVVSDSKGFVSLLRLESDAVCKETCWKAHSYEAWITAFDYWNPTIIYSGGDDCKFKVFDSRTNSESPVLTSKEHDAGVTSIHSNAGREHVLASGSYDEKLRLWDTRTMKHPKHTTPLGGGIWRLKWDTKDWNRLLAACMHGGFHAVCCEDDASSNVVASYNEHESLAYGADWCHMPKDQLVRILPPTEVKEFHLNCLSIIGTCSFYDHKLSVSVLKVY